jgi:hypothetical protein
MAMAQAIPLVINKTTTGVTTTKEAPGPGATVHASLTGTGAISSTVVIRVGNISGVWLTLGTITLSGSGSATGGLALDAHWVYISANVTAISGTSATLNVVMGTRDRD